MDLYIVQAGDTIDTIADSYGVPVDKLIQDNELTDPDHLVTGEVIVIVYPSQTHIVQEGDTLGTIAADYNISVNELLRNNPNLSDREYIYPGELLTISYNRTARFTTVGYTNTFIDRQILKKTLPLLTYLSIFNYLIDKNGDAIGSDDDMDMIQMAIQYGVIPLMHLATITVQGIGDLELTNEVISNEELQDKLFENVIKIIKAKGYFGIIISAQYITSENQYLFYNYTRRFSDRLRQEGYLTLIAIDPKITTYNNEVMFEAIDYSNFAGTVDAIIFLQYTWGVLDLPPSPVISISNLNVFLDYAQPQIEPDKIIIGIPVLGYLWELPYESGVTSSSSLTRENVMRLAREEDVTIQFDETSQTPYFTFENNNTQYIVWFVNSITINSLLLLLLERGLSGTGVWNIMAYNPQLWLVLNSQYEVIKLLTEF